MLRPGERTEKPSEHHLKAILLILRRKVRNGWLFPDDELDLGDEVDDKLAVRAHRLPQGFPPLGHLRFALGEDLTDEGLECLCEGRVRDVALVLIELAGREEAARRDEHLVQFVDDRGFTDARITGYEHQLRRAVGDDTIEGSEQRVNLALTAVQLLRDEKTVRHVVNAEREQVDTTACLPFRQTTMEVCFEARGGLVTLLGSFGEQLHHDRRELRRYPSYPFAGRNR